MSEAHDAILRAALELSLEERCSIVDELLATIPEDQDDEFLDEMERRAHDTVPCIPWDEIKAEMRKDPTLD
jgi:hypothetical protein